jgi:SAM-dependent methyltransferase
MSRITIYLDRTLYPEFCGNWDDDLFRDAVLEKIKPEHYCLDYGAGRGNVEQMNFKGIAKFVAGIDPEEVVSINPYLDEAKQLDLKNNIIPYADNTFDLVFSDNVMEHIQNPSVVLKEIMRVLKPGGVFLSKTPNKWHYMPIVARLTPNWFHKFYNKLRGRKTIDTFRTAYKLNSSRAVKKHANEAGFSVRKIQLIEGRPEYLRLFALTYLFGFFYERIVNATPLFEQFRCVMISELEKPS